LDSLFGNDRGGLGDPLLAGEREDPRDYAVHHGHNQRRQPHIHSLRQCGDDARGQRAEQQQANDPGTAEKASTHRGPLALFGHFHLGQANFLAHQRGKIGREPLEQLSHRLLAQVPVEIGHA